MIEKTYTEELTTAMHSEFKISRSKDIQHRCFTAIPLIGADTTKNESILDLYDLTQEDIDDNMAEYLRLTNSKS